MKPVLLVALLVSVAGFARCGVSRVKQENERLSAENRSLRDVLQLPPHASEHAVADALRASGDGEYADAIYEMDAKRYATVIARARRLISSRPAEAWELIGVAACHLREAVFVRAAMGNLDARGRRAVVAVCDESGFHFNLDD